MSFFLAQLLAGTGAKVPPAVDMITGLNADSRSVAEGEAFFALPGTRAHGNAFAADAVKRGASVVITDVKLDADPGAPVIVVPDVRAAYAVAAARHYTPQPEVAVAVTGTNGKTSVASFIRQIWAKAGIKAASVGTLGVETSGGLAGGTLTTPDPLTMHKILASLRGHGIDHVALEASSHGLDQRRLDGIRFRVVGFTNLTRDHLDYHTQMEDYRDAKLRLFRELCAEDGYAIVNTDDPEHMPFMFAALDRGATLLTVGSEGAFFEATKVVNEGFGQRITGRLVGEPVDFHLPLTGRFQTANAIVALAMAMQSGASQIQGIAALEQIKGAKGRLEKVAERDGSAIFVDYAHTPDALRNALESLRPYAKGKLTVVFGCGGDRDKGKRPEMGAIASELADRVIVTDDNPRTEDAADIRAQILAKAPKAEEIGDRYEAISAALAKIGPHDVVLIAGKGHENYQIIGTQKHHFSDHEVVAEVLGTK